MAWVAPGSWAVNDIVTAAKLNQDLRDNPSFLHETHGPLSIPASAMFISSDANPPGLTQHGTTPSAITVMQWTNTASGYVLATAQVPDNWISGGFTIKIHYRISATGGNIVFDLSYGFISPTEDWAAVGATLNSTFAAPADTNYRVQSLGTTVAPTAGELIRLAFRRNGPDAADTNSATFQLAKVELEYV